MDPTVPLCTACTGAFPEHLRLAVVVEQARKRGHRAPRINSQIKSRMQTADDAGDRDRCKSANVVCRDHAGAAQRILGQCGSSPPTRPRRGRRSRFPSGGPPGRGTYALARAQVPTFTNPNNVAILTGVSAAHNGIAGNHYLDESGEEVQVTDPIFLRATTIHAAAAAAGVPVLCVTAKDKLRRLLATGGVPAFSAELAHEQRLDDGTPITEVVGRGNPGIYDWELSPYTIDLALALAARLHARLVYTSLTDFVQHSAAPGDPLADDFYRAIDVSLGRALDAGFVVGLVADHGMRSKSDDDGRPSVRFLDEVLQAAGVAGARTLCPITDPYVAHHAALGSLAWVHLSDLAALDEARGALAALAGVEGVLDREAAAASFDLPPDRIGDLIVLADGETVLGRSRDVHGLSALHGTLRSHGGLHERTVPMIVCQPLADGALGGRELHNRDLHDLLLNSTMSLP